MDYGYSAHPNLYGMDLEQAISDIGVCGYDGVEFFLLQIREFEGGVDRIKELLQEYDLDVFCMMGWFLRSDDEAQQMISGAEKTAQLGADYLAFLPPRRGVVDDEELSRLISDVCAAAGDAGVTPLLHPWIGAHIATADEAETWLDEGPDNMRLAFDSAHFFPYIDPADAVARFRDDIPYVHLKDMNKDDGFDDLVADLTADHIPYIHSAAEVFSGFTDLGKGEIDFNALFETLVDVGYDGAVTVEIENQTDDQLVHAKRNYEYLIDHLE